MKKFLIISLLVFQATLLTAQMSIFTKIQKDQVDPTVTIFGQKPISEKFSLVYFGLVSEYWSEAHIGLAWSANSWSQIGLMAGFAQEETLFRVGAFLWLGKGRFSSLTLLEKGIGEDNHWYRIKGLYQSTDNMFLGVQAWRFNGFGPLIEYRITGLESTIWLFPAYNFEIKQTAVTLGIDISI